MQILQNEYEECVIREALEILKDKLYKSSGLLNNPQLVERYLKLKLARLPYEIFGILHMDSQNRLIHNEELFRGTTNATPIYPREILRSVFQHNTTCVIFYHNHPGGSIYPTNEDKSITKNLVEALKLVDVKVVDHIIVAGVETFSFHNHSLI